MTIRFEYKCDKCAHTYTEQRKENEQMYFSNCNSCGVGKYVEVNQTIIEEAPAIVQEVQPAIELPASE